MIKQMYRVEVIWAMTAVAMSGQIVVAAIIIPRGLSNPAPVTDAASPDLTIQSEAPPALLVVVDSQGHRAGADISKPTDKFGEGAPFDEITESLVDQLNNSSDATGAPQQMTVWSVSLYTRTAQTYHAELHGIVAAVTTITCKGWGQWVHGQDVKYTDTIHVPVFVAPGVVTKLSVTFDPVGFSILANRLVEPKDLGRDVETACQLGLIAPLGICQSLQVKALAAASARERGDNAAAEGELNAFLNELKAQDKKHIEEPAITILREEAEALLNPPQSAKPKVRGKARK